MKGYARYAKQPIIAKVLRTLTVFTIFLGCYFWGSLTRQTASQSLNKQGSQPQPNRYELKITSKSNTVFTGAEVKVTISLIDQYGNGLVTKDAMPIKLTVTTKSDLEAAKSWIAAHNQRPLNLQKMTHLKLALPANQEAVQVSTTFPGEKDKDITIISKRAGRIIVYAESPNITSGQAVFIALERMNLYKKVAPKKSASTNKVGDQLPTQPPNIQMVPVRFNPPGEPEFFLDVEPPSPITYTQERTQVAEIQISLRQSGTQQYMPAPQNIEVILNVQEGNGWVAPGRLIIAKEQAISERVKLNSQLGGKLNLRAEAVHSNNYSITPATFEHTFQPTILASNLLLESSRPKATANGLSEIILTVKAVMKSAGNRILKPSDEGLEERVITFNVKDGGKGVKFANSQSEILSDQAVVSMPMNHDSCSIKIFSSSPDKIKLTAQTINGISNPIEGMIEIDFTFPYFELLCAILGGFTFSIFINPDFRKQRTWKSALWLIGRGVILGALLFGLAFFGAVESTPQSLGALKIALFQLPTDNWFAAYILGLLGGIFLELKSIIQWMRDLRKTGKVQASGT